MLHWISSFLPISIFFWKHLNALYSSSNPPCNNKQAHESFGMTVELIACHIGKVFPKGEIAK